MALINQLPEFAGCLAIVSDGPMRLACQVVRDILGAEFVTRLEAGGRNWSQKRTLSPGEILDVRRSTGLGVIEMHFAYAARNSAAVSLDTTIPIAAGAPAVGPKVAARFCHYPHGRIIGSVPLTTPRGQPPSNAFVFAAQQMILLARTDEYMGVAAFEAARAPWLAILEDRAAREAG